VGSTVRVDRKEIYFAFEVWIAPVLMVIEESPESLNPMAIGTELPLLGGPEELVAAPGCPGLGSRDRGTCMWFVTCKAGDDSLG